APAPAASAQPGSGSGSGSAQGAGSGSGSGGESAQAEGGQSQRQPHDGNRNNNSNAGSGAGNRRDRFRNRRDRQRDRHRDSGLPQDDGNGDQQAHRLPPPNIPEGFPQYSLGDLKRMPAHKLLDIAEQLNIHEGVARARKQDVIFALLKVRTRTSEGVQADGVLEILPDGFGFLRGAEASYLAGPDDTYISPSQIRRF